MAEGHDIRSNWSHFLMCTEVVVVGGGGGGGGGGGAGVLKPKALEGT